MWSYIWSSNSTSGYISKRIESRDSSRYLYTHVHSSIIHYSWRMEAIQVSINRWMDEQKWYKHTTEYYSALKRREILTHATKWVNLKDIMLSEINQSQKDKYCMIPLIWGTESSHTQRQKVEWWLPGTGEGGNGELFNGCRVSAGEDGWVLEMDGGDYCTNSVNVLNATELYT